MQVYSVRGFFTAFFPPASLTRSHCRENPDSKTIDTGFWVCVCVCPGFVSPVDVHALWVLA